MKSLLDVLITAGTPTAALCVCALVITRLASLTARVLIARQALSAARQQDVPQVAQAALAQDVACSGV